MRLEDRPFLSYGFRPFFLFAGIYATLAMAAWLAWLGLHWMNAVVPEPSFTGAPYLWHGHEMLFGYAAAAVAGFMLTAVPSWTGARRVMGAPLLVLAAAWLAGRIAVWFSAWLPPLVVAAADLLFLPLLLALVAAGLLVRPAPRNTVFLALLALLIAANAGVHLEWSGLTEGGARWGLYLATMTLALMVTVIGGRIVPSFTRNALMRKGAERLPHSVPALERGAIASVAALTAAYALALPEPVTGVLALVAAIANAWRFAYWRLAATLRAPILWSLQLAYLWLPLGLAALAAALLTGVLAQSTALHVLTIGAIGGMTLAVMTRAALGHTGRALVAPRPVALAYGLVALATALRSAGPALFPGSYLPVILAAGALWVIAFAIFTVVYAPILTGPSKKAG